CSNKLRAKGWRTVYLNERLAVGLAAEGIDGWLAQRIRWFTGALQNLRLALLHDGRVPTRPWKMLTYWLAMLRLSLTALERLLWVMAQLAFWYFGYWVLPGTPDRVIGYV